MPQELTVWIKLSGNVLFKIRTIKIVYMVEVQAERAFFAYLSAFLRGLDEWMVERIFNGDAISIREMA